TIDWNVSLGENRTPMNRATRFFGAGAGPAAGAVVVIGFVRERPDCTTPYTSGWDEMFPDDLSELSRRVRFTESNGTKRRRCARAAACRCVVCRGPIGAADRGARRRHGRRLHRG